MNTQVGKVLNLFGQGHKKQNTSLISLKKGHFKDRANILVDSEDFEDLIKYDWGAFIRVTPVGNKTLIISGTYKNTKPVLMSSLLRMKYYKVLPGIKSLTPIGKLFYHLKDGSIRLMSRNIDFTKKNLTPGCVGVNRNLSLQELINIYNEDHPEEWFNLKKWLLQQVELNK